MACRRSTCLHPHTHATEAEAGDGMARRRSPRLHPQIHASEEASQVSRRRRSPRLLPREEGDGVARRRSARLRPQVHTTEEASGVTRRSRRRRRGISPPAALSSPLENDDLLWEILLRLPPLPSSLPRASAVCKRWRCAVTDPRFHRRFCAHHRKPPLLGFFQNGVDGIVFKPEHPDHIPPQRFNLNIDSGKGSRVQLLGCRHGRVLLMCSLQREFIVIAPITGEERRISIPPEFNERYVNGAVLCAAPEHDHVHGSCHSSPFKVVLVSSSSYYRGPQLAFACVYSSETGIWNDLISTPTPFQLHGTLSQGSLISNALYWLCNRGDYILEFDLDGHNLALIKAPPIIDDDRHIFDTSEIIEIVDGAAGLAILSHYFHNIQIWRWKVNFQGVTKWVLWKTIDMHHIHGIPPGVRAERPGPLFRLRYAEDTDDIFLYVGSSLYMVQLKSMQSRKLCETNYSSAHHFFKSFYVPGTTIARGSEGAEMLHEKIADVPKRSNK